MDAKLHFVYGMTTKDIKKTLVQTAIEKVISKKECFIDEKVCY